VPNLSGGGRLRLIVVIAAVAIIGAVIAFVLDSRREDVDETEGWELGEVDPYAGGHPVPPLPGQTLIVTRGPRAEPRQQVLAGSTAALTGRASAPEEDPRG
jgi:NADH-quinone oxidoreductase subunit H